MERFHVNVTCFKYILYVYFFMIKKISLLPPILHHVLICVMCLKILTIQGLHDNDSKRKINIGNMQKGNLSLLACTKMNVKSPNFKDY